MEKTMISAEEARKETTKNLETFSTVELEDVEKKIREAIKQGNYSISDDGRLSEQSRKALENAGFKVNMGNQYNEPYYSINWR
jgi:hypothetical protein